MLILLSCAKTMADNCQCEALPTLSKPAFADEARHTAAILSHMEADEIARLLNVSPAIAAENKMRYLNFALNTDLMPALLAYTGIVFQRMNPSNFSTDDFRYADSHLRITSFLYGLLRPLDGISPYRLEGKVRLEEYGGITMFDYWKSRLTDRLIADVKAAGGTLCNLASAEMKNLFDWKRVKRELRVITPDFKVDKGDRMATVTVYTKMMRGEMTRFILKNRLSDPANLQQFHSEEGFAYNPLLSKPDAPMFTL